MSPLPRTGAKAQPRMQRVELYVSSARHCAKTIAPGMGPRNRLTVPDAALAAIVYIGNLQIILIKEVGGVQMNDPAARSGVSIGIVVAAPRAGN